MAWQVKSIFLSAGIFAWAASADAGQFVVELASPLEPPAASVLDSHNITIDETLSAGADSYAVFSAPDQTVLEGFLNDSSIAAEKVIAVDFVNSPTVGGGAPAGPDLKPGHQVFVIERSIPGVGSFPVEKKKKISMRSNAAVEELGSSIEWDHSYLTSEGTYCVYRAVSADTIREHAALAGAPIGKITTVDQKQF